MNVGPRAYTLRRRAAAQAETRRRIVEATVELHGTIGPARTTISGIADLAGVQRHTVYDHFPDETSLLAACSEHFLAGHPPPDVEAWSRQPDAARRARAGLTELYTYYETNAQMIECVLRDSAVVPVGRGFLALQDRAAAVLVPRAGRKRGAVARVATAFSTWKELRGRGLGSRQAALLMASLISPVG
jgi:AcrR family transcriptional regulator